MTNDQVDEVVEQLVAKNAGKARKAKAAVATLSRAGTDPAAAAAALTSGFSKRQRKQLRRQQQQQQAPGPAPGGDGEGGGGGGGGGVEAPPLGFWQDSFERLLTQALGASAGRLGVRLPSEEELLREVADVFERQQRDMASSEVRRRRR